MKLLKGIALATICAGLLVAAGCQNQSYHTTTQPTTIRGANEPAPVVGCGRCDL